MSINWAYWQFGANNSAVVCLCVCVYTVCVGVCVFLAVLRVVMAMTALLEAPGLFLCDCPQQEVMSAVCSRLLLTQEMEQKGIRACLSVWLDIHLWLCASVTMCICLVRHCRWISFFFYFKFIFWLDLDKPNWMKELTRHVGSSATISDLRVTHNIFLCTSLQTQSTIVQMHNPGL